MFEHALDLAVLALAQAHRQPDVGALLAFEPGLDAGVANPVDRHAFAQRVELGLVDRAVRAHAIAPEPGGGGKLQHARQAAVVGQKDQSFAVDVEPADRDDARQSSGSASKIVGRPSGSRAVVTSPRGL